MPLLARLTRLRDRLFRRHRLDRELDAELRVFVEELTDRYIGRGMAPHAARRAALSELGGIEQVKSDVRDVWIGNGIETTAADVRYAWRGLWRTPGFAIVTVLTLGLGIGATTAIFSLVNALLIEDLPFRDPQQLVFVWNDLTSRGYRRAPLASAEYVDLRERATLFSGFGAIWSNTTVLSGDNPEQLRVGLVTTNFFTVLGAAPALGRTFHDDDDSDRRSSAILLSDALWRRRFGGDPSIVGRRIDVEGAPTTVIGVMPAGFRLMMPPDASVPDDLQAWLLLSSPDTFPLRPRGQRFMRVVGRMKPGVPLTDGLHEIAAIGERVGREHPDIYGQQSLTFVGVGLHTEAMSDVRPTLIALFAGVAILLIVACVNVASLLVARSAARAKETAMRMAIGASAGRLFRQYAVEGLVLGAIGGVAGLIIGRLCLDLLIALRPATLSRIDATSIDPTVMIFTAGVALTWGFLLSLAPLAEMRRTDVSRGLQQGDRGGAGELPRRRRAALVVCQLALSVVLLVAAGLLTRAFVRLMHVDPGFSSDQILTFRLSLSGERYGQFWAMNAFTRDLRDHLAALPGVTAVGAISHLPYDELPNWGTPYLPEGVDPESIASADTRAIGPGFLRTVGAQLLEGRDFTDADDGTVPVAVVDDLLARKAWPNESAIGKRFLGDPRTSGSAKDLITVVGVVRHLRLRQLTSEQGEQIFYPHRQATRDPMAWVIKSSTDEAALTAQVRDTLRRLDPTLPIYDVRPLSAYVVSARAARRFTMMLTAAYAVLALVLAALGVYGVTAYAVARRRREFGVRLALGSSRRQVMLLVLGESLTQAAVGLLIGLVCAGVVAQWLRTELYGITPADPVSYVLTVPALAVAVALAAWLPARRATRVSALECVRSE